MEKREVQIAGTWRESAQTFGKNVKISRENADKRLTEIIKQFTRKNTVMSTFVLADEN